MEKISKQKLDAKWVWLKGRAGADLVRASLADVVEVFGFSAELEGG